MARSVNFKVLVLLMVASFPCFTDVARGQETTDCFFCGAVYFEDANGARQFLRYAPVQLARIEEPDKVIAVRPINGRGTVYFTDVPIDNTRRYVFSVLTPVGPQRFVNYISDQRYLSGNINSQLRLDIEPFDAADIDTIKFSKNDSKTLLIDYLMKNHGVIREGNNFYFEDADEPVVFLFNGNVLPPEQALQIITQVPCDPNAIHEVYLARLKYPNDYFAGVIDIFLTMGSYADIEVHANPLEVYKGKE